MIFSRYALIMFFDYVKVFLLIYVIAIGGMYYVSSKASGPVVLPGDIYFRRGTKLVYVPLGGSLILAIVLFLLFKNFIGLPESTQVAPTPPPFK